jgi:PAS domain S-box-containing protein
VTIDELMIRELQMLRGALDQASERSMMTDKAGTILYVNPAFERMTGYTKAEVLGKTPRILKSGRRDQEFYAGLWRTLLSGGVVQARFLNKKKTGELYYEEQVIAPLKDQGGGVTHFISTATDVTDRVQQEQVLKGIRERLQQFRNVTWDREERIMEMKQEVNALLKELGRSPKYVL